MKILIAAERWEDARWLARGLVAAGDRALVLALDAGRGITRRIEERGVEVAFLGAASTPVDVERAVASLLGEGRVHLAHFFSLQGPFSKAAVQLDCAGVPLVASGGPVSRAVAGRIHRVIAADDGREFLAAGVDPSRIVRADVGPSPWGSAPPGFHDGLHPVLQVYGEVLEERTLPRLPPVDRVIAVVLHERGLAQTLASVRALLVATRTPDAVIVVDAAGNDGSATFLRAGLPRVEVLEVDEARGFAAGANAGLARAMALGADRVLFLSGEVEVLPSTLAELTAAQDRFPELGVLGPVLRDKAAPQTIHTDGVRWSARSGRVRHPGRGAAWREAPAWELKQVDGLSSQALLLSRRTLDAVGLFDAAGLATFVALDLCLRARGQGFGVACVPRASALHAPTAPATGPLVRLLEARAQLQLAQAHAPRAALPSAVRGAAIVASHAAAAVERRAPPAAQALFALARAGVARLRAA